MPSRRLKSDAHPRPEEAFLQSIVDNPAEEGLWLILADWLEENDDPQRAELLRLHRKLLATCCQPDEHPERSVWQARLVELLTARVRPSVPRRTVALAEGVEMAFHFIPPGTFLMGSPEGEEGRARGNQEILHRVTLTQGFWLAVTPITQAQWIAVMGNNPVVSRDATIRWRPGRHHFGFLLWHDPVLPAGRLRPRQDGARGQIPV